jgi:hypothetical protein
MDPKQFEHGLKDAETLLRRVRSLYDQWFSGIERAEPTVQRDELDRLLVRLKAGPPRNTALRFRLNQVSQQYQTYTTYWKRISRQIEEGTYQRDLLRARRLRDGSPSVEPGARRTGTPATRASADDGAVDVEVEVDGSLAPAARAGAPVAPEFGADTSRETASHAALRPARVPGEISPLALPDGDAPPRPRSIVPPGMPPRSRSRPPPAMAPRPSHGGGRTGEGGLPEAQMRALFERYVEARRSNAERTDNVKFETLAKNVAEMLPKLREKHPGKKVGFTVIVKDGKVGLKPVTK